VFESATGKLRIPISELVLSNINVGITAEDNDTDTDSNSVNVKLIGSGVDSNNQQVKIVGKGGTFVTSNTEDGTIDIESLTYDI
jgi:hypothetical protein